MDMLFWFLAGFCPFTIACNRFAIFLISTRRKLRKNELNPLAVADLSVGAGVIPIMSANNITLDSSKDMWQFFIKKKIKTAV